MQQSKCGRCITTSTSATGCRMPMVVVRAGAGPDPGASRKGTSRDASRLAKIFGPSRYPAFMPDESLLGPVIPPPDSPSEPAATDPVDSRSRLPNAASPLLSPSGAPSASQVQPRRARAARPQDPIAAVETAQSWKKLSALLESGSSLGAKPLLLLSQRVCQLLYQDPPEDEEDTVQMQRMGMQLAVATRPFVGSAQYGPQELGYITTALLTLQTPPNENWLFAAEMACLRTLQQMQTDQSARAQQDVQDPEALTAELELVKGLMRICSCMVESDHRPQDKWLALLIQVMQPVLQYLASAADAYMISEASKPAGYNIQAARKGGLIQVPEQTAGSTADEGPITWDDVPQLGPGEWHALALLLLMWRPALEDSWLQAYLDASYGALVATGKIASDALVAEGPQQEDQPMLFTRVLDSVVQAEIVTSLLMSGVKPNQRWLSALAAAAASVFQHVIRDDPPGISGLTAHPAGCANLIIALRQCGSDPDQAWVESALMAAARDTTQVPGEQIGGLLLEASRPAWQLQEPAVKAGVVLANRAARLWQAQAEMDRAQQQKQRTGEAGGPVEDVTGFSAIGLVALMIGVARLGALPLMQPTWLQMWGDQICRRMDDLDTEGVAACLSAAGDVGVVLPPRTIHQLAGHVLDIMHRAGAARQAGLPHSDTEDSDEASQQETFSADAFFKLLEGLTLQPVQLPVSWLGLLHDLMASHLGQASKQQMVQGLQVIGLIPERADTSFLNTVLAAYEQQGGLEDAEGCVAITQGLAAAGADAIMFKVVEDAALSCITSNTSPDSSNAPDNNSSSDNSDSKLTPDQQLEAWAALMTIWSVEGFVPREEVWEQLAQLTQDVASVPLPLLSKLLSAYGTLRLVLEGDLTQGAAWAEAMTQEAITRLSGVRDQGELVPLLGGLGALFQRWPTDVCHAMEAACVPHGSSLNPGIMAACLTMFIRSGHAPSESWCTQVGQAVEPQLPSMDSQELVVLMSAVSNIPGLDKTVSPKMVARVLEEAGKRAAVKSMSPQQLAALLEAAARLPGSHRQAESGATPAMSALIETAQAMRQIMQPGEICQLVHSVGQLGVRPNTRWLSQILSQLESNDISDAGPERIVNLASTLDALAITPSTGLLSSLTDYQQRLLNAATRAAQALEQIKNGETEDEEGNPLPPVQLVMDELDLLVKTSMGLLHALVNFRQAPGLPTRDAKLLTEALRQPQLWQQVAGLLGSGLVPAGLHDSLLYAASRVTPLAAVDSGLVALSPAFLIRDAALSATRSQLVNYDIRQLMTVFSTLAAMRAPLPQDWLELFWEYSRSKLPSCPAELLVPCVSGLAAVNALPPRLWEEPLQECLQAAAPTFSVQDVSILISSMLRCGMRPPPHILQSLLDSGLSKQQESTARYLSMRPSSTSAGSAPEPVVEETAERELLVASTRARRRPSTSVSSRSATATAGPEAPSSDVVALKATVATCATEVHVLAEAVSLAGQLGYRPSPTWIAAFTEAAKPCLNTPYLPTQERGILLQDLQRVSQ